MPTASSTRGRPSSPRFSDEAKAGPGRWLCGRLKTLAEAEQTRLAPAAITRFWGTGIETGVTRPRFAATRQQAACFRDQKPRPAIGRGSEKWLPSAGIARELDRQPRAIISGNRRSTIYQKIYWSAAWRSVAGFPPALFLDHAHDLPRLRLDDIDLVLQHHELVILELRRLPDNLLGDRMRADLAV